MKLQQLKLAICALSFLMVAHMPAMEEREEQVEQVEKKQLISDQGQKLLNNAAPEDLAIAKAFVNKALKQIKTYNDVTLNQGELMDILGAFPKNLRELFGAILCKERAEDYKKLISRKVPWGERYIVLYGLKYIPGLENLNELSILEQNITYIPDLACATNLTSIKVLNNNLTFADGTLLPTSLTELDLSENKITDLKLQNLTNLQTLKLNKNQLKHCNAQYLPASITDLELKENSFNDSSALQLATLVALNKLDLNGNQFTDLDNAQLPSLLQKLALCFNEQLTHLEARKLPEKLQTLRLFSCKEVELRDFVTHMTALKTLSLRMGRGKKRGPLDCATLPPSLTELDAVMSRYSDVINVEYLPTIKKLCVDGNRLQTFPDLSKASTTLRRLDTGGKGVLFDEARLPATIRTLFLHSVIVPSPMFTRFIALQKLVMNHLDLTQTPDVKALSELRELNLSDNKLAVCDGSKLPDSLTTLKVESNKPLTKLALSGQTNLKSLDLSLCSLVGLNGAMLPVSLAMINAEWNKVEKLELRSIVSLKKLNIYNNKVQKINGATDLPTSLQELGCGDQLDANGQKIFGPKFTNINVAMLPNLNTITYHNI